MHFENLWCMYVCPNKLGILSPHEGGLCMSINPGSVLEELILQHFH